jgi:multisubunit Na+/H+ antiporter MnhE subunit
MAVEWVLLVAGLKPHELLVGGLAVTASALFFWRMLRISSERLDFRVRDLLTAWRLPWMMACDAWTITVVLLQDLFGIRRAGSFYRVKGFHTALRDPVLVARRVLVTMYTTSTPNSVVIGVDPAQSRMLVHQLKRAPTSELERELGARS